MKGMVVSMDQSPMFSQSYRTKFAIIDATDALCEDKPFEKITVNEITKKAQISHATFYYHFSDKDDIVSWLTLQLSARGIDQIGRTYSWLEGQTITIKYFQKYQRILSAAAPRQGYSAPVPFFMRHRREVILETLRDYRRVPLTDELLFQIEASIHSEAHMIGEFQKGTYEHLSIERFCELIVSIIPKILHDALELPAGERTDTDAFLSPFLSPL